MTPQIPEYLVAFESAARPLVTAIALGLIWIGAMRMESSALSRYTTAGLLSVALIAWLSKLLELDQRISAVIPSSL